MCVADAQESLPGEVEADTVVRDAFVAVLSPVAAVLAPDEGMDTNQAKAIACPRVKVHVDK